MRSCNTCGFFIATGYSASMKTAAIIVAAGRGQRAGGGLPKQLRPLGGRPVLLWSVDALHGHPEIDQCVLVVPIGQIDAYRDLIDEEITIIEGGETRSASVRAGLNACNIQDDGNVLIHDAARPGLKAETISALIAALANADAAAPALPVADALKRKSDHSLSTVDRSDLYRVQTPQAFLLSAIKSALGENLDLVDDLAAIEASNGRVSLIAGDESLAKITYPEDHARLEKLLMPASPAPRFGTGYDVHALEPGDGVTLCGVKISHTHSLVGHSDADVAWHALTDAILGGAALGDIGDHFPPTDPQWKGAPSDLFLKHAVEIVREAGWALTSCDLTLICEAPKIKPHREAMRRRTAEVTGLPLNAISVKATTTEGLGFTGRDEGIAAQASAVLVPLTS